MLGVKGDLRGPPRGGGVSSQQERQVRARQREQCGGEKSQGDQKTGVGKEGRQASLL